MSNKYFTKENKPFIYRETIDSAKIEQLFSSIQDMNTQEIENVVNRNNIPLNLTNSFGNNLIHETLLNETLQKSELNRLNMIKFLVNNNVNPNSPNKENITPLHLACKYQYPEIIKFLLDIGVNPNFKDSLGNTPFHYYLNGRILNYYDKNVYNLAPPTKIKKELVDFTEENLNQYKQIKNEIWKNVEDLSGIKMIEETIKSKIMLEQEIKDILISYPANVENNQTKVDATLNEIDELIRKNGWSDFVNISNIKLETKNSNSWPNELDSQLSIIQNLKNGKIHDQLAEEIISSKNVIEEICGNKKDFFEKSKTTIDFFWRDFKTTSPIDNVDLTLPKNYNSFNKLYEENLPQFCVDGADNYIDLQSKTFIGGTRCIDFIGKNQEKLINIDFTQLTDDLKLSSRNNTIGNFYDYLLEIDNTPNNVRKRISDSFLIETEIPVQNYLLNKYNKNIFDNNKNKSNLSEFHRMYHLFLNQESVIDNTKLKPRVRLSNLYYFAGYINLVDGGDIKTSFSQAIKTFMIPELKLSKTIDGFKKWVYALFSEKNYKEISNDINNQTLNSNNIDLIMLINCVGELFTNNNKKVTNKESLKQYTKVDYENDIELVIFGLTKYYNEMRQKPVLIHVVDTLYILRLLNDKKPEDVVIYLNLLDTSSLTNDNIKQDKLNDFFKNKDLPSRKFFNFGYNKLKDDNEKNYYIKKFIESYALGLSFLDCFPNKDSNLLDFRDKSIDELINIEVDVNINITNGPKDYYPYMGYLKNNNDLDLKKEEFEVSKNLFISQDIFRPSTKEGLECLLNNLRVDLNTKFTSILNDKKFCERLTKVLKDNTSESFFKIFPEIYPEILEINSMKNEVLKISNNFELPENYDLENSINAIVSSLNKINAYYFINYYLYTKGNDLYIPSFYYYKIPGPNSIEKSYIFNRDKVEFEFKDNYVDIPQQSQDVTGVKDAMNEEYDGISNKYIPIFMENVLDNRKYISKKTIGKFMKLSKKSILPPSLEDYLYDFYKFIVLDIIVNNLPDVTDKIKKLFNENDETIIKFKTTKYMESILQEYFKNFIRKTSFELLSSNNNNISSQIFLIEDFTSYLNNEDKPKNYSNNSQELNLNYLVISEKPHMKKEFIIIPNDYTNNELIKQFLKVEINENILSILLEKNCKPFLINKENRSAVYSVLRNYYYPIFENLKNKNLLYQQFYQDSLMYGVEQPLQFAQTEFSNHLQKLLFNSDFLSSILKNFSHNQFQEVKLLIRSNEQFGNNILKNLELSYSVIGYIFNSYLLYTLFDGKISIGNLDKFFKNLEIKKFNTEKLYGFLQKNKIINNDNYWFSKEKISDLNVELEELQQKNKKIENYNKEIKNFIDFKGNNVDTKELNNKIKNIKNTIYNLREISDSNKNKYKPSSFNKINIENLDRISENKNYYMIVWEKFLNENIEGDKNLFIIILSIKLSEIIQRKDINKMTKGELENLKEEIEPFKEVLEHLENTALSYFKGSKYIDNNYFSGIIKTILIHMTKNIICYRFEIAIKKVIFKYYEVRDVKTDDIISYLNLLFSDNKDLRKDKKSMKDILYNKLAEDLIMNSANPIFNNRGEEINYLRQSTYEIFSDYINLLKLSPLKFDSQSEIMTELDFVVRYFDEISSKIIYNWQVTMENYLKFIINQSRITRMFLSIN